MADRDDEPAALHAAPGDEAAPNESQFPCAQCGAMLAYRPGAHALHCPYCGHQTPLEHDLPPIDELDYEAELRRLESEETVDEHTVVKCAACAAELDRPPDADAFDCPYCGHGIVATATSRKLIRPKSLLPFHVARDEARAAFRKWVRSLWFAPGDLRKTAHMHSRLNGLYVPHWTYDSDTTTAYSGMRGTHHWVKEGDRRVRKTRWFPCSGVVSRHFNDLLVLASHSLPVKYVNALEPWDLADLVPYTDEYLAGFQAESYQVGLPEGFEHARKLMDPIIRADVHRDIGGDEQRILSMRTAYSRITYKHILLPVWISAYRYRDRIYRFLVNARTGEVRGERPWSVWKILFTILGGLIIVAAIVLVVMFTRQ